MEEHLATPVVNLHAMKGKGAVLWSTIVIMHDMEYFRVHPWWSHLSDHCALTLGLKAAGKPHKTEMQLRPIQGKYVWKTESAGQFKQALVT